MKNYNYYLEHIGEYGEIVEVKYPLLTVKGLPTAKPHEIVLFENNQKGEVFSIDRNTLTVMTFAKDKIKVGDKVVRTNEYISVPVGEELLGQLIDPFGNPFLKTKNGSSCKTYRPLYAEVDGIDKRVRIKKVFSTGTVLVDMLVPLGHGQKELIIGDRKTGKTAFLLSTVKNQVKLGTTVIFAAIGKRMNEIKKFYEYFEKEGILKNIVLIASTSSDPASLVYLTPYTAMTIAEYFKEKGNDVLVVLDDLSNHARYYREMSLIGKRFPGRDSYPGDIFYTHARLMERTGNFMHPKKGEVSITCLPVVETIEGDFTNYIATNVMSMTDGHIFFDNNIYVEGRKPAVNISLSVTRVGKQVQSSLKRDINQKLMSFYTSYERMENLAHFGSELSPQVKQTITTGKMFNSFFNQHYNLIVPEEVTIVLFALIWSHLLEGQSDISKIRQHLIDSVKNKETAELIRKIVDVDSLDALLANVSAQKDTLLSLCKI